MCKWLVIFTKKKVSFRLLFFMYVCMHAFMYISVCHVCSMLVCMYVSVCDVCAMYVYMSVCHMCGMSVCAYVLVCGV